METKQKIIAIVGPTASGKTSLSIEVARLVGGEVISADSRQVYIGLDIGSGKVTKREMRGVPHHLLDVASPKRTISVVQYERLATRAIKDILKRGKVPIICGGTGLYIDAVLTNASFPEVPPNAKLRKSLEQLSAEKLFKKLQKLDPSRAKTIDAQNPRRLIRAIEIATALGKVPERTEATPRYNTLWIGLTLPKEELEERIHIRLIARMRHGMVAEVKRLHSEGLSWKRMDSLGLEYRFLAQFLRATKKFTSKTRTSLFEEEMIELLNIAIRQFSKRQMMWFKRNTNIKWFNPKETKKVLREVQNFLKG